MQRKSNGMLKLAVAIVLCSVQVGMTAVPTQIAKIAAYPLTPQGIKNGGLPSSTEKSAGLWTTGVGMPVYMEVEVTNKAMVVTQLVWTLQSQPSLSLAALANSPLTNLVSNPIYDVGDRTNCFVPTNRAGAYLIGRQMLRPDQSGQYVITVVVNGQVSSTNATPVSASDTKTITAATYIGVDGPCATCHNGNKIAVNDNYAGWFVTPHADAFTRKIDGSDGTAFKSTCYSCHTVGYDTNALANNGGFDDVQAADGWLETATTNVFVWTNSPGGAITNVIKNTNTTSNAVFTYTNTLGGPVTNLMTATNIATYSAPGNWASMPADLQNKANIQCEDCHGPANQHNLLGTTYTNSIDISVSAGMCGSCHDSLNNEPVNNQWSHSQHGSGKRTFDRTGYCIRCHSAQGFIDVCKVDGKSTRASGFEGITCATCHDPHPSGTETNEYMLRTMADVQIGPTNGEPFVAVITAGGKGKLCMECHRSRFVSAVDNTTNFPASFGPHASPVADMLAAVNGIEYGGLTNLPWRTPHLDLIEDSCIVCHMQSIQLSPNANYSNSWLYAQGHTMRMSTTNGVNVTQGCAPCHVYSSVLITNFNFSGVQTNIDNLLAQVAAFIPIATNRGVVGMSVDLRCNTNMLMAAWNYQLVANDKSRGVHNAGYATALLEASIADMHKGWNTAIVNTNAPAGWMISSWFGDFYSPTTGSGWINHAQHGWVYASVPTQDNVWLWSASLGWMWTSQSIYPYMYRNSTGAWLYYLKGTTSPRWFYNFSTSAWEQH